MEKYIVVVLHDSGMHSPDYQEIEAEDAEGARRKANVAPGRYVARVEKVES